MDDDLVTGGFAGHYERMMRSHASAMLSSADMNFGRTICFSFDRSHNRVPRVE